MRILLIMIVASLLCVPVVQAATLEQQRDWFQQARTALNQQHIKQFHILKDKLNGYPLTPYLDIWHASKALSKGDDSMLAAVLLAYADVPESINLRRSWLKHLAKEGQWLEVQALMYASPRLASRFPDTAMMVEWMVADKAIALQRFSEYWQQGKKATPMLQPLYQSWLKQTHPTDTERWHRVAALVKKGHWKSARSLLRASSKQQQSWLNYWRGMQKDPEQALQKIPESLSQVAAAVPVALMISDGIKRLSRRDVLQAWQRLQALKSNHQHIDAGFFADLERRIALRAARMHKIEAIGWLADLSPAWQNKDTRGWQVRLALIAQNWINVLAVIETMPLEEKQQDRWLYWRAQALAAIGDAEQAESELAKLATGRGYYNFLSAEQLGLPLHIKASALHADDELIAAVNSLPGIVRAQEWLRLNKRSKASREWHFTLAGTDQTHWQAAAMLASKWQWHDQVIRAAYKAGAMNALVDRFPMNYKKAVLQAAAKTGLKPAEIWSIIRQESAFNQHAVSYVGAKGLMQLMPATARQVADQLKIKKSTLRLFSAATNIRLGTTYLADMKQRFGSLALASAAYNAGPHRVKTWLKRVSFSSPEIWLESIPFNETRRYVQQVMAFVSVYEWRQDKPLSSLSARLCGGAQNMSLHQSVVVNEMKLE